MNEHLTTLQTNILQIVDNYVNNLQKFFLQLSKNLKYICINKKHKNEFTKQNTGTNNTTGKTLANEVL